MVAVEVILIIIGVVFIIASFFITEKLSQQDLEQISLMSQADLKRIADKQLEEVKVRVEESVEDVLDEALEITKRGLEKETNKKIMAVSEYSDTVLENINKSHNEVMFLYSMLNDKQTETADMIGNLQRYIKEIRDMDVEAALSGSEEAVSVSHASAVSSEKSFESLSLSEVIVEPELKSETPEEDAEENLTKNEKILLLHKEGKSEVEIAKTLGCGLGEVRLVMGLYHET